MSAARVTGATRAARAARVQRMVIEGEAKFAEFLSRLVLGRRNGPCELLATLQSLQGTTLLAFCRCVERWLLSNRE